jgi:leucyl aminopeptidase
VAFYLGPDWPADVTAAGISGAIVGCQGQDLYRHEKKQYPFDEIHWAGADASTITEGRVLGECVNLTRRLVNEPPSDMNPAAFADTAAVIGREAGFEVEAWDKARLEKERCGSLLAVARGSAREPRLLIMRYAGATGAKAPTLALVGKGVTFDSGGLSIKSSENMATMKCDMAGAATVLAATCAVAELRLPVNVVGVLPLVENLPGGRAMKLGDVLRARNGKTIEVHNTDAEGRLILADALAYAVDQKVDHLVDLATLTGSCMIALGVDVAGLMSNHEAWAAQVQTAARRAGEKLWPLPMFPHYSELIKSAVADIKNTGGTRYGGAITAAKFLEEFVGTTPWAHLDIAGPAWAEHESATHDAGGTGCFVRTLVELAASYPPG